VWRAPANMGRLSHPYGRLPHTIDLSASFRKLRPIHL
jgi:hypothetical protein